RPSGGTPEARRRAEEEPRPDLRGAGPHDHLAAAGRGTSPAGQGAASRDREGRHGHRQRRQGGRREAQGLHEVTTAGPTPTRAAASPPRRRVLFVGSHPMMSWILVTGLFLGADLEADLQARLRAVYDGREIAGEHFAATQEVVSLLRRLDAT